MAVYTKVYDSYSQARRAVGELETMGIPSNDISLVANKYVSSEYENVSDSNAGAGAGVGAAIGGGAGLLAGIGLLAIPGLGPVVAAGWLAATAVGAIAGGATGGIIGAITTAGVPEADAHVYSEAVRRGGTMLTVRTAAEDPRIPAILERHAPIDPSARRGEYESEGWRGFDPAAPQYRPTETEIERIRRDYP